MPEDNSLIFSFFLIFTGAAVLASVALYTRQPLLVAYIALGALLGPSGLGFINEPALISDIASIGIMFLLFLLGLDMEPRSLLGLLKKTTVIGIVSSLVFATLGYAVTLSFGYSHIEAMVVGVAMVFSSTIIGIKLLPTTVLHHRHIGEVVVSILLLQDLIAITVLLVLGNDAGGFTYYARALVALPLLIGFAYLTVRYVLLKLIARFDKFHEYIFLLAIGWCLGLAELAHAVGLSGEMGAFIAGITIATSPIAQYIALNLKPLRDFFLVLFFFALGAKFNLSLLDDIIIPAALLALIMLVAKPIVFRALLTSEKAPLAWEVGFRLGQISEFSLLIAYIAFADGQGLISNEASHIIQACAIITFLVSSYIVVLNFPSPIAIKDHLRRD